MKKRLRERVLILVLSLSVLLSSTGAYSVFAQTTGASDGNTTEFSSSTTQAAAKTNEQETTTVAQNEQSENSQNSKPNVVSEGGEI